MGQRMIGGVLNARNKFTATKPIKKKRCQAAFVSFLRHLHIVSESTEP